MGAHQLHADRQTLLIKTNREGDTRHAGQIRRQGEDILQVHGKRIIGMLSQPEGSGGGNRGGDDIHAGIGFFKISLDQGTYLLGLPVIGVVVTRRQGISS
jgi:hypothetical protein